jgi:hypothetical protein
VRMSETIRICISLHDFCLRMWYILLDSLLLKKELSPALRGTLVSALEYDNDPISSEKVMDLRTFISDI